MLFPTLLLSATLAAGLPLLQKRQAADVDNGVCKQMTLIYARGTSEPGTMGRTVGPALQKALVSAMGADKVAVQGVDYPADFVGAATGAFQSASADGATTMTALTQKALQQCPSTKVVLAGYSQGAEQVHGALTNLGQGKVAAAVTFGDPLSATQFDNIDQGNTLINCEQGDQVCKKQFIITADHLAYTSDGAIPKSVTFLMGKVNGGN